MAKAATFQNPIFQDETKAREALEATRWPNGPVCAHCGGTEKIGKVEGKSARPGLYFCGQCNSQFTVTVGTVFERSKIPLTKWWMAAHMFNSGKNGTSAHEIHRTLGVTYKTAWFMMHRLREAMADKVTTPIGGEGQTVQADETYYGNSSKRSKSYRKGHSHKAGIVALVEPNGKARAFHVKTATSDAVREILMENVDTRSVLHTDESNLYPVAGRYFADHKTVEHGSRGYGFYVSKDGATTNAVENFFGNFKRSMKGTYRFCSEKHLQRYVTEFEFRHNNRAGLGVTDGERTATTMRGIEGKRLTYRPTN